MLKKYRLVVLLLLFLISNSFPLIAEEEHAIFLFMPYNGMTIKVEGDHFNPRFVAPGKIQDSEESWLVFRVDDSSKVNVFKFKMGEDDFLFPVNWDQGRYLFIDLRNGIRIKNYTENDFPQKILIPSNMGKGSVE